MKVLAIVNPKSGLKSSKAHLLEALEVFSKYKYEVELYVTQAKNDAYEYLKNYRKKVDVVCGFGGDGTINEITNALMNKKNKPLLAYFPSGTMNDFGSNFNLGNDWGAIAERICQGNYREFDVGEFNGKYFNYVAAFGAFCDVPFSTNRKSKETFGNLAYIFEGISKLQEIKPINVHVKCGNKDETYDALFGLIFSGNRVAGIEYLDKKKGRIDDGKFNVLIVEYVKDPILGMPLIIETLANQHKYFHWYFNSEIELSFNDKVIWTLDGEEAKIKDKVTIKNIHKALKMLS